MGRKEVINKQIFLEYLPRFISGGNKGKINWKESVGYKVRFIYDDIEGEVEIIDYISKYRKLFIRYKDEDTYEIHIDNFVKCQMGRLLGKITSEFKIEIGQVFKDDKRDITITDRKYQKNYRDADIKLYKYKCNKCGYDEGWITESNLLCENGCACCCTPPRIIVEGINDIPTTAPWMVKFFQGGYEEAKMYTKSSHKKIIPICPDCGRIRDKEIAISSIHNRKSIACSCGDGFSYPEKFMFSTLEQLGIDFETQFSPEWINPKRYDFYFELEDNKYIVEMDGELGHGKRVHEKSKMLIEETKLNDEYKDMMAKQHDIEVIRIDADESNLEYIKNEILNSKLNKLFDLSNVNWIKCEEFALSNRVKEACRYKKNNQEYTSSEIAKIMNSERSTIRKYLKLGSKLGWCYYDPKEEMKKVAYKSGKTNGKQVEIFKDGISLGVFASCSELERQSEKLFGIKLLQSCISLVSSNKLKQYKGFTFKYIETNK